MKVALLIERQGGGHYEILKKGSTYSMVRFGEGWTRPGELVASYTIDDNGKDIIKLGSRKVTKDICEAAALHALLCFISSNVNEDRMFSKLEVWKP